MEWQRLRFFYYVAKAQSISRAAIELNTAQPAVTRSIQQLEHQAKAKLFIRHPRGLTLTKQGEILFHHVKNIVAELEQAKNEISGVSDKASGRLTLTANYSYSSTVLFQYICDFLELYPDIKFTLICDDYDLDLTKKEADVAVRIYDPYATEVEQIYLYDRKLQLFASKEYLQKMGTPETIYDLDQHKLVIFDIPSTKVYNTQKNNWLLTLGMQSGHMRDPFLIVNSAECLAQAAKRNFGIIALSNDSSLIKQYELVRVLPDLEANPVKMCYVYPTALKNIKLIKLLSVFFKEKLKQNNV